MGRVQELQQVRAAVDDARSGHPTFLLVEGEAGIGKSRLVAEARSGFTNDNDLLITSPGVELSGGDLPYGVVTSALRDFARQERAGWGNSVDPDARATLRELSFAMTGGATSPLDRGLVLDSFVSAVESLARTRLLWWAVEDLQWADPSSRDVLSYLTRAIGPCRLLVVATVRTDELRPAEVADFLASLRRSQIVARLEVPPLTAAQAEQLSRGLAAEQLTSRLVRRVVRLGEGNPLWTEELVLGGLGVDGPLPESVNAMLGARLMRVSDGCRTLLGAVSLTDRAPHDQVAEVCDLSEADLERAAAEAVRAQLLVIDERRVGYRFRHALLREAVAGDLLPGTRQRLHHRWAVALERIGSGSDGWVLIAAAHHWAESGDSAKALEATIAAAAMADQVAAEREKALLWSRALELWEFVPDASTRFGMTRDEVACRCLSALFGCGEYDRCLEWVEKELSRLDDNEVRRVYLRLRRVMLREELALVNDDSEVLDTLPMTASALLGMAPGGPWLGEALLMSAYYLSEGSKSLSMQLAERAIEVARVDGALKREMAAVDSLSWSLGNFGRFDDAIVLLAEGAARARAVAPFWASQLQGSLAWYLWGRGRYDESFAASLSALSYVQRPNAVPEAFGWLVESLAETLLSMGRWDEASARLAEAVALSITGQAAVTVHALAGVLAARTGDLAHARLHHERAAQHAPPQGDSLISQRLPPHWLAAEIAAADDDATQVRGALEPLWESAHPENVSETIWRPLLLAARVEADVARLPAAARSRPSPAGDAWPRLFGIADVLHDLGPVTAAWRGQLVVERARAGRSDSAEAWSEVADRWAALGQPYELAVASLRRADCLIREGNRSLGADLIAEVSEIAGRLGAEPLKAQATALARRARLGPGMAAPQDLVVDGVRRPPLTARELEVLALLARGHDNAQVASALFISAKTASVHVSHILAKLGVGSRTQAVSLALRRGLLPDDLDG